MPRTRLSLTIEGMDELVASLAQFGSKTTAKRIMRGAMNKAAQVLVKAARRKAPKETGLLRKALTKTVAAKGLSMTAIIGADATRTGPDPVKRRPRVATNYVHLAEYGHIDSDTGRMIRGSRFLERTSREQGPRVSAEFATEVGSRIDKELAKAKAKRGRKG